MSKKILAVAAVGSLGLTLVAHADTPVTENTTVGGRSFLDLTNVDQSSYNAAGVGTKSSGNGFGIDVTRFYLILDHTFDSTWSANLTTDFNYSSSTSETQVFIKKAYVQAKFSDALFVRAGSADMAWIPFVESQYGYRYVEKMALDRLGYGNTADWGLHAGGKAIDGKFGYAASLVEGNGYKNPTRSKGLDFEGRVNFAPIKDLVLAAGFYSGKLGKDVQNAVSQTKHTYTRLDGLVAYTVGPFKAGVEYFSGDDAKAVPLSTATNGVPVNDKADGYTVFANFQVSPQAAVFARYDDTSYKFETFAAPTTWTETKEQYYNLGVACKPRKGVDLALAYKHDEIKTGGVKASDRDEVGVWAQVSF
jgi:hypothetical protein